MNLDESMKQARCCTTGSSIQSFITSRSVIKPGQPNRHVGIETFFLCVNIISFVAVSTIVQPSYSKTIGLLDVQ
jgi:hypothetical protein